MKNKEPKETVVSGASGGVSLSLGSSGEVSETAAPVANGANADGAGATSRVVHTIEPVFDERSRVLVLGTMPSPKSREIGFYYGPGN